MILASVVLPVVMEVVVELRYVVENTEVVVVIGVVDFLFLIFSLILCINDEYFVYFVGCRENFELSLCNIFGS